MVALGLPLFALGQDLGPLEVRTLRGLTLPFLRIQPRGAILEKAHLDCSLTFEAANDIRFQSQGGRNVREDYEIDRLVLRYRLGQGNGSDVTVEASLVSRSGGILDGVIDKWHQYVLHRGYVRQGQPYGRSFIEIPGHATYGSAAGLGDITISGAHAMNPRLMSVGAIKLPVGDKHKLLGSGGVDFGGALQWKVPIKPDLDLHTQVGYVFQGRSSELPEARKTALQGALSLVYRRNSKDTYIGQLQAEPSAIVTGVSRSDDSHRMLAMAFRRKLSEARFLEVYILEDGDWAPGLTNIAPDFTLGIRWLWRR